MNSLAIQPRLRTAVFTLLPQRWSPEPIHVIPGLLKGVAVVYGVSFVAGFVFAIIGITPQSNPNVYPLLALVTGAVGVALALRVAHTTRWSYLLAIGIGLWLVSGTSVFVGAQTVTAWLDSGVFVAITVLLGRLLLRTGQMTPRTFDLSLKGIIHDRNSGLLGHRGGGSRF
ncbi:MAG: hypothetical protein JJE16_07940 [Nitrospiraceae bacterium]|nr:hypothetical protein [Nitrospiraceae bacterium]